MQHHRYVDFAQHCQRLAEEYGTPEAKRLRLREARDWLALADAHGEDLPQAQGWSPLEALATRSDAEAPIARSLRESNLERALPL